MYRAQTCTNKQFTDSDGEVAQSFVQKLKDLSADNSKGYLCIEKFLIKSEKAFFDEVKKDKISGGLIGKLFRLLTASAMSVRSSRDSFIQSRAPSMIDGFRPECEQSLIIARLDA